MSFTCRFFVPSSGCVGIGCRTCARIHAHIAFCFSRAVGITLLFEVRDTGRGISPEKQAKLFQQFSTDPSTYAPCRDIGPAFVPEGLLSWRACVLCCLPPCFPFEACATALRPPAGHCFPNSAAHRLDVVPLSPHVDLCAARASSAARVWAWPSRTGWCSSWAERSPCAPCPNKVCEDCQRKWSCANLWCASAECRDA